MERIGLIDLGSNTARLVIVEILNSGYFVTIDEMREAVRLGELELDGSLKQSRILQAINTLSIFRKMCNVNHVDKIIAVATAAVRQARNQRTFLNQVYSATGITFRVLTEEEESYYVYQGVINSMEVPKGLIMEIGGGSTKLIYYNRRNILHKATIPFGAVTLTDMFTDVNLKPEECSAKIEQFFKNNIAELEWLKEIDEDTQFIGVGGSFRNLSKIARKIKKYPLDMSHNYRIEKGDFEYIFDMIKVLDLDKKMKIKGLSTVRADVFPSALAAIKAMVDYREFPAIITSGCGLREGLLFNYAMPQTQEKPLSDVLGTSLHTYVNFLGLNEAHAEQVFNLAVQLFKQLRVLHKFPRAYVRVLRVACLMHDAGRRFKYYNNPKHASYMILNSNLYGISHKDIVLAAFVTDIYNKEEVSFNEWTKYKDIISEEDVEAVRKLAVILKLSISFDISMNNVVTEISCDVLGDSVILKTELTGDATLEMLEAKSTANDFKRVFKKDLGIL